MRQVLDFAGQVADAAGPEPLRETARAVVRAMRRGVVAYSPDDSDADADVEPEDEAAGA